MRSMAFQVLIAILIKLLKTQWSLSNQWHQGWIIINIINESKHRKWNLRSNSCSPQSIMSTKSRHCLTSFLIQIFTKIYKKINLWERLFTLYHCYCFRCFDTVWGCKKLTLVAGDEMFWQIETLVNDSKNFP